MLASYRWLRELCPVEASPSEVADRLTEVGLEVEGVKAYGELDGVVVAEVRGLRPHPKRDKLRLVTVHDGQAEIEVVCGAPNVPEPGGRVLFAREGATLPGGFEITARKLGGVESRDERHHTPVPCAFCGPPLRLCRLGATAYLSMIRTPP